MSSAMRSALLPLLLLLLKLCVIEAQQVVLISGAVQPTSIAWSDAGRVYVSEKRGVVKAASSFAQTGWDLGVVLNISAQVATYFDSGLLVRALCGQPSHARFRAALRRFAPARARARARLRA